MRTLSEAEVRRIVREEVKIFLRQKVSDDSRGSRLIQGVTKATTQGPLAGPSPPAPKP